MSTTPSDELSAELLERSQLVVDLDGPQVEAWASGLFAAWDSDDEALGFVAHCRRSGGAAAALLCHAIAHLAEPSVAGAASVAAGELAGSLGAEVTLFEPSRALAAWQATARFGRSIIIGCGPSDVADHSLLVEIDDDGLLVDLLVAGPPEDLLGDATNEEEEPRSERDEVVVEALSLDEAGAQVAAAWRAASEQPRLFNETVPANEQLARRRVGPLVEGVLPALAIEEPDLDPRRGMTEDEFVQANQAARSTLRAALGDPVPAVAGGDVEQMWIDVIRGSVEAANWREAQALLYLEWADWLGAGIGMVRAGPGIEVDGETLVDMVNRCPEVSSTISAGDREYIAGCFDLALDYLEEAGAMVGGQLSEEGHRSLAGAMYEAWA